MNSGFRPIPETTPVDAAANIMVARGECRNYFAAKAKILRQRNHRALTARPNSGRVEITPASIAATNLSFHGTDNRDYRLPYRDD